MEAARAARWPRRASSDSRNSGPPRRPITTIWSPVSGAAQRSVVAVERVEADRLVDGLPGHLGRRALGAAQHLVGRRHPGAPLAAEGDGQHVDEPLEGDLGRGGQLLDDLEVEEQVVAGGVAADPHDLDAVERVARRHDRVGHHARGGLEQHVVDGRAVVPLLHDLEGLDVAPCAADRRGQTAQRTGHVGQLDPEQEAHGHETRPRVLRQDFTDHSGSSRRDRSGSDLFEQEDRDLPLGLLLVAAVRRPGLHGVRPPLLALLAVEQPGAVELRLRAVLQLDDRVGEEVVVPLGVCGAPPIEATARYLPSRSTRIRGFLRRAPDLRPTEVITTIGSLPPRRVLARAPPEASYSATWSRTHLALLGMYSPTRRVMSGPTAGRPLGFPAWTQRAAWRPARR